MENKTKYHVVYNITPHKEGITADEVPEGLGACTALLIGSIIYREDGSYSTVFYGMDGRTAEDLDADEMWKAWVMLSKTLAENNKLSPNKRMLCRKVFETVREALASLVKGAVAPIQECFSKKEDN